MMEWLTGNWNVMLPGPWAGTSLVIISAVCGLIVGAEREMKEKSAGLRTMMLVCVGSSVFTLLSVVVAGSQGDRGRIAAQVVTGVGFLGAGAILRGSEGVRGMTTAASIWAVAAIGMVVGAGYPAAGLALSLLMLGVLLGATSLERRYIGACVYNGATVLYQSETGKPLVRIEHVLDTYRIPPSDRKVEALDQGVSRMTFRYCSAHKPHKAFLVRLAVMPGVNEIYHDPEA